MFGSVASIGFEHIQQITGVPSEVAHIRSPAMYRFVTMYSWPFGLIPHVLKVAEDCNRCRDTFWSMYSSSLA